jgi:DNA-binding SARP family transcriptional activator
MVNGHCSWTLATRERLRSRFERATRALGDLLTVQRHWEPLTSLYRGALEVEPLAEELHRRLMLCLREQGRDSEVVIAYRRCRELLRSGVGMEPAEATRAVVRGLV